MSTNDNPSKPEFKDIKYSYQLGENASADRVSIQMNYEFSNQQSTLALTVTLPAGTIEQKGFDEVNRQALSEAARFFHAAARHFRKASSTQDP